MGFRQKTGIFLLFSMGFRPSIGVFAEFRLGFDGFSTKNSEKNQKIVVFPDTLKICRSDH